MFGVPIPVVGLCGVSLFFVILIGHALKLEHHPLARTISTATKLVGFGVLIATGCQIMEDYKARDEERIERNWSRLLSRAPGNTGKGGALNYLFSKGVPLDSIDISCKGVGRWEDDTCIARPVFEEVILIAKSVPRDIPLKHRTSRFMTGKWSIEDIDASETKIGAFAAKDIDLEDWNLSGARINYLGLTNVYLGGTATNLEIIGCMLTDSEIDIDFAFLERAVCNVSGTVFNEEAVLKAYKNNPRFFSRSFAEAENPPLMRRMSPDKTAATFPFPDEILQTFHKCPMTIDAPLPTTHQYRNLTCNELGLSEAKKRFPDAYKPRARWALKPLL